MAAPLSSLSTLICPALALDMIDDHQVPALEYRDVRLADCLDGDWCAQNRLNSYHARLEVRHGGKIGIAAGFEWHTFARLVPQATYFKEHPGIFCAGQGQAFKGRVARQGVPAGDPALLHQPGCDPTVHRRDPSGDAEQPNASVFSVSMNDSGNHCECPRCQALVKQEVPRLHPCCFWSTTWRRT